MDNQKIKWVTPKEIIGISELKTEYAYLQMVKIHKGMAVYRSKLLDQIIEYSEFINETKLTPELVEKLFEGVIVLESKNPTTKHAFLINETIMLEFSMVYGAGTTITAFVVDSGKEETIQTLADLARLTAAKPISLA